MVAVEGDGLRDFSRNLTVPAGDPPRPNFEPNPTNHGPFALAHQTVAHPPRGAGNEFCSLSREPRMTGMTHGKGSRGHEICSIGSLQITTDLGPGKLELRCMSRLYILVQVFEVELWKTSHTTPLRFSYFCAILMVLGFQVYRPQRQISHFSSAQQYCYECNRGPRVKNRCVSTTSAPCGGDVVLAAPRSCRRGL